MMVALGNFLFHYRTTLSPLLPLLLLLPGPPVLPDPFIAALIGLVVAFLGQIVRATTIGFRYIVRGGRNHRVYADDLVTDGLFRHTRNPMYVGKFLMILGAGIGSNRWPALLAIVAAYTLMYYAITIAEEAYLRGKFGAAFDAYCADVPRWWPRLRGLRTTLAGSRFHWPRVLMKEYSAPLGWTLPIVLIGVYNLRDSGRATAVAVLWAVLVAAFAFWLGVGALKKFNVARLRTAGES